MNVLILNWRDPKHPFSGGAELVTAKYAAFWSQRGHNVIWICNTFTGCLKREKKNGVSFIRVGPFLSGKPWQVLFKYPLFLLNSIFTAITTIRKNRIDYVIDEIHGLPFFSPLYTSKKVTLFVCEVASLIWIKMYPFPINIIGKTIEKAVYFLYLDSSVWAISSHTRKDIYSLNPKLKVNILPLGFDGPPNLFDLQRKPKYPYPSAIFLARLVKMKGIDSAMQAVEKIIEKLPDFKLHVVGYGESSYQKKIQKHCQELGVINHVIFHGKVPETLKYEILRRSHFLIHPSHKEGFGLTVLEAGLVGTPSIARAGSSMDELIVSNKSGYIFNDDSQIAKIFISAYKSSDYLSLCNVAHKIARGYLWSEILPKSVSITNL